MTNPPRDRVRKAAFLPSSAAGDRAGVGVVSPWAKGQNQPSVVSWAPPGAELPPNEVAEAPPIERERPVPRTASARRPQPSAPVDAQSDPPPRAAEPRTSEPTIPAGMILISREELAERESEIRDEYRGPYLAAAARLRDAISELEQRLREDIVDLSARIASALVQRALRHDRTITLDIARRALRRLGPVERLIVKCAESDAELLRERLAAVARSEMGQPVEVLVRASEDIEPGGLVLSFEGGVVDAREEQRLARIVEAVKAAVRENDAILEGARDATREGGTRESEGGSRERPKLADDDGEDER